MKIQKISNENTLSVFDVIASKQEPLKDRQPEMKQPVVKEKDRSWVEASKAPTLSHNTPDVVDLGRKGNSIRSARCSTEGITNEGGSENGFGVAGKNSIFDSEVLSRLAESQSNKEQTIAEKKTANDLRDQKSQEWKTESQMHVGETESEFMDRKSSLELESRSIEANRRQWTPQNAISMFDNSDFERIEDSVGENIERRVASKDDSWRHAKKAETVQDKQSDMIDRLSDSALNSEYKNRNQNATDRLFDVLNGQQEK